MINTLLERAWSTFLRGAAAPTVSLAPRRRRFNGPLGFRCHLLLHCTHLGEVTEIDTLRVFYNNRAEKLN